MADVLAITGIGVVAPNGNDFDASWAAAVEGRSALAPISSFDVSSYPTVLAGQVRGFDTGEWVPKRLRVQTDPGTHFGLAAARMAVADTEWAEIPPDERAVLVASSSGGVQFGQREMTGLWSGGPEEVSAYQSIAWFYAATTGQVSIRHDLRGQGSVVCSEQAGGLDVVGQARQAFRDGASHAVVGGYDSALSPYGLVCLMTSGRLSTGKDPRTAYLPFEAAAAGHVPGEGAVMMTMERAGRGRELAKVLGYAATFDPAPWTSRPPRLAAAIRKCLADAGTGPSEVDAVFADAAGSADLDAAEAAALAEVFGPDGVPVTAPKAGVGRMYAAGASWDLAMACRALAEQVLPPTPAVSGSAYRLDLVHGAARELRLDRILVVARGLGGFNAAVLLGR